jgi:hypothetical protein
MRRGLLAAIALTCCFAAGTAAAQDEAAAAAPRPKIYKWVDENGIAHYTIDRQRIPQSLRNRADRLGSDAALPPGDGAARSYGDPFDSWASDNRSVARRDVWDEGVEDSYKPPPSPEELLAMEAERGEIDQRIAELESVIAEDEDALKSMISDINVKPLDREDDPEFRSIAMRLPQRLAELRSLRDRRDQLERRE